MDHVTPPFHQPIRSCDLYLWTNVQNVQSHTESTAIVQKVQLVRNPSLKRTIRRSRRGCTGFEVKEVVHGVGGVHCGLIKVAVTMSMKINTH